MATGDATYFAAFLRRALPKGWFPDVAPLRDAVLAGPASAWANLYVLLAYAKAQARIGTATDKWLDFISADFFNRTLPRRLSESDGTFRLRILREMFRPRGTRAALIRSLTDLTGRAPVIFEPARTEDTGGYGSGNAAVWMGLAYNFAGGYGDLQLPFQTFITAYRPIGPGVANVMGFYYGTGAGYGAYAGAPLPLFDLNYAAGSINAPTGYSFTRSTVGWRFDQTGTLVSTPANTLRFTYDPITLQCLGALKEEARTNLLINSLSLVNLFANGTNTVATSTAVPSLITGGTIKKHTRDTVGTPADNAVGGGPANLTTGLAYVGSFYVWVPSSYAGTRIAVGLEGSTSLQGNVDIDLTKRDQWQRFTTSGAMSNATAGTNLVMRFVTTTNGDFVYTCGWQIEQATIASSFIGTSGATFTRAADVEKITGLSIAAGAGYSVFVDAVAGMSATQWGMVPASIAFVDSVYVSATATQEILTQKNSIAGDGPSPSIGSLSLGVRNRIGAAFGGGSAAISVNGSAAAVLSGAFTSNGNCTTMTFGCSPWGNDGQGVSTYKRITFYARRLTNAQVVALATTGEFQDTPALFGLNAGAIEYVNDAIVGNTVRDSDIYAAVAAVMPVATIGWTRISS